MPLAALQAGPATALSSSWARRAQQCSGQQPRHHPTVSVDRRRRAGGRVLARGGSMDGSMNGGPADSSTGRGGLAGAAPAGSRGGRGGAAPPRPPSLRSEDAALGISSSEEEEEEALGEVDALKQEVSELRQLLIAQVMGAGAWRL